MSHKSIDFKRKYSVTQLPNTFFQLAKLSKPNRQTNNTLHVVNLAFRGGRMFAKNGSGHIYQRLGSGEQLNSRVLDPDIYVLIELLLHSNEGEGGN
jgi:hypothetical protein